MNTSRATSQAWRVGLIVLVMGWCWPASMAAAQGLATGEKWEVEVHGGSLSSSDPTTGTKIPQFPTGVAIATGGGTARTRAVSSWYFGDGTTLINQVNTGLGLSANVAPLDAALTERLATRKTGADVGFRVARRLTPRVAAEFSLDYGPSRLQITESAADAIEAARSSFVGAWSALLASGATTNRNVTSTTAIDDGDGHQIAAIGALKIHFAGTGRLRPYATGGGGAVSYRGTLPSATLTGNYSFLFAGLFPINERDTMTINLRAKDRVLVGMIGGGIEYAVSRRHGVRADVRVHWSGNSVDTLVSASPSVTVQSPTFAIDTGGVPSIQFSNSEMIGRQSSLTGPAVTELATFTGKGTQIQTQLTVGYFLRF